METSKTQIDRLGNRLKEGNIAEDDLRLLDRYRLSFTEAYEYVVDAIRNDLVLEPTGRTAKSTTSIIEKLRRESIRLTQSKTSLAVGWWSRICLNKIESSRLW
jgi:hypothetical protein